MFNVKYVMCNSYFKTVNNQKIFAPEYLKINGKYVKPSKDQLENLGFKISDIIEKLSTPIISQSIDDNKKVTSIVKEKEITWKFNDTPVYISDKDIEYTIKENLAKKDSSIVLKQISDEFKNNVAIIQCFYGTDQRRIAATTQAIEIRLKSRYFPEEWIFIESQKDKKYQKFAWLKNTNIKYFFVENGNIDFLKPKLWNYGFKKSKSKYLAFLDSDIVFCQENWLNIVNEELSNNDVISLHSKCYYGKQEFDGDDSKLESFQKLMNSRGNVLKNNLPGFGHVGFSIGMTRKFFKKYFKKFDSVPCKYEDALYWYKATGIKPEKYPYQDKLTYPVPKKDLKVGCGKTICCHIGHGRISERDYDKEIDEINSNIAYNDENKVSFFQKISNIFRRKEKYSRKLSILIAAYNVEKYIDECIQSVVNQITDDVEVICVEDHSTDNTLNIIKKYSDKIKIIRNRKNLGLAKVREIGIRESIGEYIWMIDGDDYITENAVNNILKNIKSGKDVYTISFYNHSNERTSSGVKRNEVWNKIVRRDFIKDKKIKFIDVRYGEDFLFSFVCNHLTSSKIDIPDPLYFWRMNQDGRSAQAGRDNDIYQDMNQVFEYTQKYIENYPENIKSEFTTIKNSLVKYFKIKLPRNNKNGIITVFRNNNNSRFYFELIYWIHNIKILNKNIDIHIYTSEEDEPFLKNEKYIKDMFDIQNSDFIVHTYSKYRFKENNSIFNIFFLDIEKYGYDKLLYLDSDVTLTMSLEEIFNLNFDENTWIQCVKNDPPFKNKSTSEFYQSLVPEEYQDRFEFLKTEGIFNGGMMLINMEKIEQIRQKIDENAQFIIDTQQYRNQHYLNYIFRNNHKIISGIYNNLYQKNKFVRDPDLAIINHYTSAEGKNVLESKIVDYLIDKNSQYENTIDVCYITDKGYLEYTTTSMNSLKINKYKTTVVNCHVIVNGLDKKDIDILKSFNSKDFKIKIYDFTGKSKYRKIGNEAGKYISDTTYIRLYITDILKDVDKVIYLDGDTIILNDLSELYNIDLKDDLIGGCQSYGIYIRDEKQKKLEDMQYIFKPFFDDKIINNEHFYINAGIVLMNLHNLKEFRFTQKCRNVYLNSQYFKYADQDIINFICVGKIRKLHIKYNVQMFNIINNMTKNKYLDIINNIYNLKLKHHYDLIDMASIIHLAGDKKNICKFESIKKLYDKYKIGNNV